MSQENCPICNSPMVERKGKFGTFLGCSTFPKCKGTRQIAKNGNGSKPALTQHKELKLISTPSHYQQAIFDAGMELLKNGQTSDGYKNLIMIATAGSGKTATTEHLIAMIKNLEPEFDGIYLTFDKKSAVEAQDKGLPGSTSHSKFFADYKAWRNNPNLEVDTYKVNSIVKSLLEMTMDDEGWMVSPVCQLVSKIKNTCAPTDEATLNKLCDKFSIEVNGSSDRIFELTRLALDENNKQLDKIDLDDQLYLTWKLKIPVKQYKWIFVDEAQDTNRVQIELILRSIKQDGHVIVVGDENQAIYSWRGADTKAMFNLKTALNAKEMPLSISYRNPQTHVNLINALFPDIKHEAFDKAIPGKIGTMSDNWMLGQVKDGDLVICRTNAPLIKPVFSLIRQGVKAIILGRDIGNNLSSLVERFKVEKVDDLLDKLEDYRIKEVNKLLKQEKTNQAQSLQDKVETIFAIAEDCKYVWQVTKRIQEIFSDKKDGVIFSTIHRAKGSEAKRVYILEPKLLPHPMAKTAEAMEEEKHVAFVAMTRSKDEMYFVNGPVPAGFMNERLYEGIEETKEESKPETIEEKELSDLEWKQKFVEKEQAEEEAAFMLKFAELKEENEQVKKMQKKEVPACPF
jgi:DNA helicase-2/ATP-dependent DNA helicase PcrA